MRLSEFTLTRDSYHLYEITDLVCCHLSPGHEAEESLLGVNIRLGRGPGGGVGRVAGAPVLNVLPLRCEGDRVLTGPPQHPLRHHPGAGHPRHRDTPRHTLECEEVRISTLGAPCYLHGPDVKVDVMAVEVVGDVAPEAGPGLECLQLELGLTHV